LALEEAKKKLTKNKNHPQGHCIMAIIAKAMAIKIKIIPKGIVLWPL
jgi:hypothetical protein